jgi:hypothetical protein
MGDESNSGKLSSIEGQNAVSEKMEDCKAFLHMISRLFNF